MTSPEEHRKTILEFIEDINEKIRAQRLFERQKIIGFDVSEASTNLFELYLHRKNLITEGTSVNHRFFSSRKMAEERFPFPFQEKERILGLLVEIEELTTRLCYGKSKSLEDVERAIRLFFDAKETIERQTGEV